MKKKTVFILLLAILVVCLGLCACDIESNTPQATYEIKADKTIELAKGTKQTLEFTVTADGQTVTDKEVVVSVDGSSVTYSADTNEITAVSNGVSTITVALKDNAEVKVEIKVNVPAYTIDFAQKTATIYVGETASVAYTVKKDGARVTDAKVKLTVEGDAISVNALTKQVTAKKVGTATLIATLELDETVTASKTYEVKDVFFNRDVAKRGEIDFSQEDDGIVVMQSGQGTLTAKKADTQWVFSATIDILSSLRTDTSIGVGSFFDEGNHALWFGLRGSGTDGVYSVYIKDFYEAWDKAAFDSTHIGNYDDYNHSTTINVVIVRDGDDYWYSLNGLNGTYHDNSGNNTNAITFPGIYSQEQQLKVTNFAVDYSDEAVATAKNQLSDTVAKLVITNSNLTLVSKGTQVTYNAVAYSSQKDVDAIVWTLDKTEMTAGADGTSIENGVLTVANDAAGFVTVKASCGGKEASVRVEISAEDLNKSTDKVAVSGGVDLDTETNTITFREDRNHNNETLDLNQYAEIPYMAKILQTVKGDFSISFKVKNFVGGDNGMLLVSLGGKGNNFAIGKGVVTGYNYLLTDYQYGDYTSHQWNKKAVANASNTIANFDAAAEHTYVISVVNGRYSVSVDGTELTFANTAIRNVEDYLADCGVMFTTIKGTSCVVSDVTITANESTLGDWYIYNADNATESEGVLTAITPALGNNGWEGKDYWITKYAYIGGFVPTGDFSLKANVKFSAAAGDTKAVFCIGNYEFHVLNVNGAAGGEYYNGNWGGGKVNGLGSVENVIVVEIQRIGSDVYFYINGTLINKHSAMTQDSILYFYTFNGNDADAEKTVTVSDLKIYSSFLSLEGPTSAKTGLTTSYIATAYGDGEVEWALDVEGLTAGTASLVDGVLTLSDDAAGTVVVTATIGNFSSSITVTASAQAADQDTILATSKGGVLQDEENGKLIFSEDKASVNGVQNENKFELSSYYALINKAVGEPWAVTGDFSVEFTVANYKTTAQYPKLMISLGGENEQFYVVYFTDGSAQIQTYTRTMDAKGGQYGGQWVNSPKFDDFDISVAHTYKIECVSGLYHVYVDGTEITGFNMDGNERILYRAADDVVSPSNIMFSTNGGTSCEVYAITVTCEGNLTSSWVTYNSNVTVNDDDSITYNLATGGKGWLDQVGHLVAYSKALPDNFIATFGVEFSNAMNDNKAEVHLGSQLLHIENKLNHSTGKIQICCNGWGCDWSTETNQKFFIKISRYNGTINVYVRLATEIEWTQIDTHGFNSNAKALSFCAFVDDENGSYTISDMEVINYEVARSNNSNMTTTDTSFTLTFTHQDWLNAQDVDSTATFYNRELPDGDIDITFKASFPTDMTDAKLGVIMGSDFNIRHEFDICVGGNTKAEIRDIWGGAGASWDVTDLTVKLEVRGNQVKMIINGDYVVGTVEITGERNLYFYARNKKEADYEKTVTVSDIVVTSVVTAE